jgi:hypothetical protein
MALLPDEPPDPTTRTAVLTDVGWLTAAAFVFGALAALEPLFVEVDTAPAAAAGPVAAGAVLGAALVVASTESERARAFWADERRRFGGLFVVVMALQVTLRVASSWTVLGVLTAALVAVPVRIALYLRNAE